MMRWIRRAAGLAVVLLTAVPLYRQLPERATGLAGRYIADVVGLQASLMWSGTLLLVIGAVVAGLLVAPPTLSRWESAMARALSRPSLAVFAGTVAATAFVATAIVTRVVFASRPNLVDALVQLMHARYLAAGQLGGPAVLGEGFWHIQNAALTQTGWYSQYPPGHLLVLAAGFAIDAVWLVGPVVMAATALVSVLLMHRLFPTRIALARLAGIAAGLSPFLMAHAASYMNHATAALLGVLAVYCGVHAREGSRAWAIGAGASVAALGAVRPMAGIVTMIVVALGTWFSRERDTGEREPMRDAGRRLVRLGALATLGGLPFVAAQLWYNRHAFGAWTTFGYGATWGPTHDLGFHRDPWGNEYGPTEALLYTSADLTALNLNLLEMLLPVVTLVGIHLLVARHLARGERVLVIWALLPLVTNALYWHHGYFMGPRMLAEFAPAWAGLAVAALAGLPRFVPASVGVRGRFAPRVAVVALFALGALTAVVMAPQRLASYGGGWLASFRAPVPDAPPNSIVFIHGSWDARLVSRLAARGMRLDSVETVMRQNPTCLVERHLAGADRAAVAFGEARADAAGTLPPLDLVPASREFLPRPEIAPGSQVRMSRDEAMPPVCQRELRADRFGASDAAFVLWLGDLPGIEQGAPMFARDLGPERNRLLIERYPDRSAWLHGAVAPDGVPRLVPYADGVRALWTPTN